MKTGENCSDSTFKTSPPSPKHQWTDSVHPEMVTWGQVLLKRRVPLLHSKLSYDLERKRLWEYTMETLLISSTLRKVVKNRKIYLVTQNLPAMQETRVQSLGWEDPEKTRATHSSLLVWKISGTEEPCRLQSMGSQRAGHDWATKNKCLFIYLYVRFLRILFFGWKLPSI